MLKLTLVLCSLISLNAASSEKAPRIELNDGNKIPQIALGTARGTAVNRASNAEVRDAVLWAIEAGYRHVDTAAVYEDEEEVGQGIADAIQKGIVTRDEVFVTTKLWNDNHGRNQVVPALRESLRKLGLDYVDLYLIHEPGSENADGTPANIDFLETWQGMEEAKQLGLAKSIGVSNFNTAQVMRIIGNCTTRPAVNQVEVQPSFTNEGLVSDMQNLSIVVMAYCPLGFLVNRNKSFVPPPHIDDPTLTKIAQKYGKSTTQVVLRYLIERGTIPIPKSTNKERLQQNIDVFDFTLTPEEVATINKFNVNKSVEE